MTTPLDEDRLPAIAGALRDAATRFGTPLYLTDIATLHAAAGAVTAAFPDPWVRQYSVKANDVAAIVHLVGAEGFGANVVSRGEWAVVTPAGEFDGSRGGMTLAEWSDGDRLVALDSAAGAQRVPGLLHRLIILLRKK